MANHEILRLPRSFWIALASSALFVVLTRLSGYVHHGWPWVAFGAAAFVAVAFGSRVAYWILIVYTGMNAVLFALVPGLSLIWGASILAVGLLTLAVLSSRSLREHCSHRRRPDGTVPYAS
jgi:uncharacterized membrane protein YesL